VRAGAGWKIRALYFAMVTKAKMTKAQDFNNCLPAWQVHIYPKRAKQSENSPKGIYQIGGQAGSTHGEVLE
jgi:hypothetical protein